MNGTEKPLEMGFNSEQTTEWNSTTGAEKTIQRKNRYELRPNFHSSSSFWLVGIYNLFECDIESRIIIETKTILQSLKRCETLWIPMSYLVGVFGSSDAECERYTSFAYWIEFMESTEKHTERRASFEVMARRNRRNS